MATERQRQVQEVDRLLFQEFPTAPLEVRAQLQKDQSFELEEVEVEAEVGASFREYRDFSQ